MKLFDIVAGKCVIHPDALAIPAFKKIWDADKADKELATKYISYIVFKNKYDSPYVKSMNASDIEPRLKKEIFNDEKIKLPLEVIEAENQYKGTIRITTLAEKGDWRKEKRSKKQRKIWLFQTKALSLHPQSGNDCKIGLIQ